MPVRTEPHKSSGYRRSDVGKCICLSFPYHQLSLLEDLDHLADQEFLTRSQYIRRLIIREKIKAKEQGTNSWKSMFGER